MKLQFLLLETDIHFNLTLALCDFAPGIEKNQLFHPIPLWSTFSSEIQTVCLHETNSQLMLHFNNFLEESFCIINLFHEMLLCGNVFCMLLLKISSNKLIDRARRWILLLKQFPTQASYKLLGLEKIPSNISLFKSGKFTYLFTDFNTFGKYSLQVLGLKKASLGKVVWKFQRTRLLVDIIAHLVSLIITALIPVSSTSYLWTILLIFLLYFIVT